MTSGATSTVFSGCGPDVERSPGGRIDQFVFPKRCPENLISHNLKTKFISLASLGGSRPTKHPGRGAAASQIPRPPNPGGSGGCVGCPRRCTVSCRIVSCPEWLFFQSCRFGFVFGIGPYRFMSVHIRISCQIVSVRILFRVTRVGGNIRVGFGPAEVGPEPDTHGTEGHTHDTGENRMDANRHETKQSNRHEPD